MVSKLAILALGRGGGRAEQFRAPRRGIGRSSSPAAERVSDDLRLGADSYLGQRRRVAVLTLGTIAAYGVVGLYQFGLIRHVPDRPCRCWTPTGSTPPARPMPWGVPPMRRSASPAPG